MPTGAGLKHSLSALLFCSLPFWGNAAEGQSNGWISPETWPYELVAEETGAETGTAPYLLIVEQNGIDLEVRLVDGRTANSPVGRMGPEFIFVPAGESPVLRLQPVYDSVAEGSFRVSQLALDNASLQAAAGLLSEAGINAADTSQALFEAACAQYRQAAEITDTEAWSSVIRQIAIACLLEAGQTVSEDILERLSEPADDFVLSLPPYYPEWLRAKAMNTSVNYSQTEALFEHALAQAEASLPGSGDYEAAIRIDLADLNAWLGRSKMMLVFELGTAGQNAENTSLQQSKLAESEAVLRLALSSAQALNDSKLIGQSYDFLAGMNFVAGDKPAVIDNLLLAEQELRKTGDIHALLSVLGSIGDFYKDIGEHKKAQEAYLDAISITADNTGNGRFADTYHNIGTHYYQLGDLERAGEYTELAVRLTAATGRMRRSKIYSLELAAIMWEQNQLAAARDLNRETLNYFISEDDPDAANWSPFRIMTQSALSENELALGSIDQAFELSEEIISQLETREINSGIDLAPIYSTHAQVLLATGYPNQALASLQTAQNALAGNPVAQIELLGTKMLILQELQRTAEAIASAEQAFALIESQRMEFETVRLGPLWSGKTNEIYSAHIEYLLQLEDAADYHQTLAFSVIERARASSLRLRRQEVLLARTDVNPAAQTEWINLLTEIQNSQQALTTEQDSLALERRISVARERYFTSHGSLEMLEPLQINTLAEIQAAIPQDSMVLQYFFGPQQAWRFTLTPTALNVSSLGSSPAIRASLSSTLAAIADPDSDNTPGLAASSSILLGNLELTDNISSLLISPDDILHAFPFSILSSSGQLLADVSTITMVPSLSEYFSQNAAEGLNSSSDQLDIAVIADPAFGDSGTGPEPAMTSSLMRNWSDALQRLPATAQEAEALGTFYSDEASIILTGDQATQANFFDSRVLNARIIHIATHAYFNADIPDLIGFAMAKSSAEDDGFVSMQEISSQNFSADLVVISACSTALGSQVNGEGNLSLTRTFLAQGVNSVVSTLWPVSDAATAFFMREFYRAINEQGLDLAASLQFAQQSLRSFGAYQDPFYWGAFILTSASKSDALQIAGAGAALAANSSHVGAVRTANELRD